MFIAHNIMRRSDFGGMNFKRSMEPGRLSWLNEMINAFINELQEFLKYREELGEAYFQAEQQEREKQWATPRLRYPGIYYKN